MVNNSRNIAIIGFPSVGLVGAFAVSYLVEQLNMKHLTELEFTKPMPVFAVDEGKVVGPVQVYKKENVFAIISKVPFNTNSAYEFTKSVVEFAKTNSIDEIIIPRGADMGSVKTGGQCKVFGLLIAKKTTNLLEKYGLKQLSDSTIYGTDAGVISGLRNTDLDSVLLYTTCSSKLPDSTAITKSITTINNILGLKSDTEKITQKIESIRKRNQGLIEETNQ